MLRRPMLDGFRAALPQVLRDMLAAAAAGFVIASLHAPASNAHDAGADWSYPPACCRGTRLHGECSPLPAGSVRRDRSGYWVTLRPGDHPKVTRRQIFLIPYGDEMFSGDGRFHICLHPTEDHVNCFFAPPDDA